MCASSPLVLQAAKISAMLFGVKKKKKKKETGFTQQDIVKKMSKSGTAKSGMRRGH